MITVPNYQMSAMEIVERAQAWRDYYRRCLGKRGIDLAQAVRAKLMELGVVSDIAEDVAHDVVLSPEL